MRVTTLREMVGPLADEDILSTAHTLGMPVIDSEIRSILKDVRTVKPTYGYPDLRTEVSMTEDGKVYASNLFFGSVSDIVVRKTDIPDDIKVSDCKLAASIITAMADTMNNYEDQNEFFWSDMTNLQKAKIIR